MGVPSELADELTTHTPAPLAGHVVALGASAGGLEALEEFFGACPTNSGASFVVVQHLSPDHKSMMRDLLGRHTEMPVVVVEENTPSEPNTIYLIPPGSIMHATPGHLHLTPKNPRGLTFPIDILFTSLAETYGTKTVGIILSGTGTDGTRGAVSINAAGGFLLCQDPDSAAFDGMPRSAISTGLVDAVLTADQLPARVMAHIGNQPYVAPPEVAIHTADRQRMTRAEIIEEILRVLLAVGGIDFRDYKPATVIRRIERRQQVRRARTLQDYLTLLDEDREEALALGRDMLISVTSFFRDPDPFDRIADTIIPEILENKSPNETIRVWNAGVSTGEEAYSIGMLFLEAFERARRAPNLKIFATDVDPACVEAVSLAAYPESASVELTPERMERFFLRKGSSFVVRKELRKAVVPARHNLLGDPPFTKMDLVVCRNTLIYFQPNAQEHALRSLQYALRPGGFLFLGSSESLQAFDEGLEPVDAKAKIFRRTGSVRPPSLQRQITSLSGRIPGVRGSKPRVSTGDVGSDVIRAGQAALISAFAPASALVNGDHEIVHMYGDMKPFIRLREGIASLNISRILDDPLIPVASTLLFKAATQTEVLVSDPVTVVADDGTKSRVRMSARALEAVSDTRYFVLSFESESAAAAPDLAHISVDSGAQERISVLETELIATRESLQSTIEELETANEELQATNEELMASNEELQSSNEELQSVNEELNTVNVELQEKMIILNRMNADLDSMAKASGVATIFVDQDLVLTRFSPDAAGLFRVRPADVGRPLDNFTHSLRYPDLIADLESTLRTERMIEREVKSLDGTRTFLVRIVPYSIPSSKLRGAVVTFVDLTAFRDVQKLQATLDALPHQIALVEVDGTIAMVNAAWTRFARANGAHDLERSGPGANYVRACEPNAGADGVIASNAARGLLRVLDGSEPSFAMIYPCDSPTEKRWFSMHAVRMSGNDLGAVVSHTEITDWYRSNDPLAES